MNENLMSEDEPRNYLLVEGNDDTNVCVHLFKRHHIPIPKERNQVPAHGEVAIVDRGGVERLIESLEVELLGSVNKRLGIIVDADDDPATRWKSLRDILIHCGYNTVPDNPDPTGTVIKEEDHYTIGIWLMPDNQIAGMLEHFCSFLVPPNDSLWVTADNVLQQVITQDCRFPQQHIIKARLHTWLAWQKEPGKPLGQAITKHFLDYQAPHAQLFIDWIRRLFEIKSP